VPLERKILREWLNKEHVVMSRDHNAGRSHSSKTDNSTSERVEKFKYLGRTITNQNSIQEVIKSRIKSGNAAIIRCRIFCLPVFYQQI
jgi:hypothetical protein